MWSASGPVRSRQLSPSARFAPRRAAKVGGAVRIELRLLGFHPVRVALQRVAAADTARVEAHDVEARQQLGREGVGRGEREVDAGAARTTRVDQQRADPAPGVGGEVAGEGQVDGGAVRPLPVDGHLDGGALESARSALVGGRFTGLPGYSPGRRGRGRGSRATAVPASNWPNSAANRAPTTSRLPRVFARGSSGIGEIGGGLNGTDVPP